jgi:hypothetical protein
MKTFQLSLATLLFTCFISGAYASDLGAYIIAEDTKLGASPGEIHVTASGVVSEGKVSLSVGHDLVCDTNQITITLDPGSYLYQDSHTSIKNCIISSSSTYIQGEIQSINTTYVTLDNVTFVGGGNLVYWAGVKDLSILNNSVVSITAVQHAAVEMVAAGFYLLQCSEGEIKNLSASGFVFPAGLNTAAILELNVSSHIKITNPTIENLDASYIKYGAGAILIAGSDHITVNGGNINHNSNVDGILSQLYGYAPSHDLTIVNLNSSYNGIKGTNPNPYLMQVLGDNIDLINTSHVYISKCILRGAGYSDDRQPEVWVFLDDDVVIQDSDLSGGSSEGIQIAGSLHVSLLRNTITRNYRSGVQVQFQAGTGTNVGPTVTVIDGPTGGFGVPWAPGTPFVFDGITYQIASVTDPGHLTLKTSPPDHSSPVSWSVNSSIDIEGGVINDNGVGEEGGQEQVGISLADSTMAQLSSVTATDTGSGTQLYALELANTVAVYLSGNNFSGNVEPGSGIYGGESQHFYVASFPFPNQMVGTVSADQALIFHAGAVALQNLLIQASGDFAQTNNCGVTLAPYATCAVEITFNPTAAGSRTGTLTVTDNAPLSPQTVTLLGTGISTGLGLVVPAGSSSLAAIASGSTATFTLSIGGAGMSGIASLSCTGAPKGATCNVPATLAVSAATSTNFNVSVTTAPTTGSINRINLRPSLWWAMFLIGLVVLPMNRRTKYDAPRHLLPLLLLVFLCSCGGGTSTRPGTYTLTVTASVGNISAQVPLTLTLK